MKNQNMKTNNVPAAPELEEAVLGAIMLHKTALFDVLELLHEDLFYVQENKIVFQCIKLLFENGIDIDIKTVNNAIKSEGKDELIKTLTSLRCSSYLAKLVSNVASTAHLETHTRILIEKYMLRGAINASGEILKAAYKPNADAFNVLETAEKELFSLNANATKKPYQEVKKALQNNIKKIENARNGYINEGKKTGFYELDRVLNGIRPADLIILAARPGMGKTAFALQIARNLGMMFGEKGAIFSLEMSEEQLTDRLISLEGEIPLTKLMRGDLNESEYETFNKTVKRLSDSNSLIIDDTPAITLFELKSKAIRLKAKYNISYIIVDYLQLMEGDKRGNREQEISGIARGLKGLAKLLDIPVIALSQLSRSVESRGDKRPQLSDLRESGAIEQDADKVLFLYRPEYYQILEDEQGNSTKGICEVIVSKNRSGVSAINVNIHFEGKYTKFSDLQDESLAPKNDYKDPF